MVNSIQILHTKKKMPKLLSGSGSAYEFDAESQIKKKSQQCMIKCCKFRNSFEWTDVFPLRNSGQFLTGIGTA
jgi:hypothetical protein